MKLAGLKGLKAHNEAIEKAAQAREAAKEASSNNWMKLKDGMWVKGYFVEELDDEAEGYNAEVGTAEIVLEHSGPGKNGFQRRAECTVIDDGDAYPHEGCIPCLRRWEANRDKTEGWKDWRKATPKVYINFFVTEAGGEFKKGKATIPNPHSAGDVILISQSADSKQSVMPALLGYAEDGSITNRPFRITCAGEGTDTTYTLRGDDKAPAPFKAAEIERNDLSTAYKQVPFEEQAAYYDSTPGWVPAGTAAPVEGVQDSVQDSKESAGAGFKSW